MLEQILHIVGIGILSGSLYGLLAIGLSLQYSVCRVLNITHGEFVVLGAFLTYTITHSLGLHPLAAPIVLGPLLFIVGFALQATLFKTLRKRAASPAVFEGSALLAAFGVMYVIENVALLRWGATQLPTVIWKEYIPGTTIFKNQLIPGLIALALGLAVYVFLSRTKLGRAIRATAEDPVTAALMGIDTNRVMALCFGLGALLAGIAGTLVSTQTYATVLLSFSQTVIALLVLVLGGVGSVAGSYVAGIIIAIVSLIVSGVWKQPTLSIPVYYALLMILLLVRPAGILGRK